MSAAIDCLWECKNYPWGDGPSKLDNAKLEACMLGPVVRCGTNVSRPLKMWHTCGTPYFRGPKNKHLSAWHCGATSGLWGQEYFLKHNEHHSLYALIRSSFRARSKVMRKSLIAISPGKTYCVPGMICVGAYTALS